MNLLGIFRCFALFASSAKELLESGKILQAANWFRVVTILSQSTSTLYLEKDIGYAKFADL